MAQSFPVAMAVLYFVFCKIQILFYNGIYGLDSQIKQLHTG